MLEEAKEELEEVEKILEHFWKNKYIIIYI